MLISPPIKKIVAANLNNSQKKFNFFFALESHALKKTITTKKQKTRNVAGCEESLFKSGVLRQGRPLEGQVF